jgi:hypothetical protein
MDANIIKKLQGLLSKTVDSGCSVAEASSAAALAQKLLDQHKLSMVDVIGFDNEGIETFTVSSFSGERSITWKERLIHSLAKNNDVKMYIDTQRYPQKSVAYKLVGRKSDTEVVDYMFNVLTYEIERICKMEMYRQNGHGKNWTNSFKLGAVYAIIDNMSKAKAEVKSTATSEALVKINSRMNDVEKYVRQNLHLKTKVAPVSTVNPNAYASGKIAGEKITANAGLHGRTKPSLALT